MHTPEWAERVRNQAREIARGWSGEGSSRGWRLTASLFGAIADDDDLLDLATQVPPDRMPALLFAAAVVALVDETRPSELADYFPSAGREGVPIDARFLPRLRSFCLQHGAGLLDLCRRHRYQMNEVARTTQVALALGVLAGATAPGRTGGAGPDRPVALIDVGTGAGLGLHLDRFSFRLSDGRRLGDPTSTLVLDCRIDGALAPPVPVRIPPLGLRVGIDADPVDLSDATARRWLRACVPPEPASLARFDRAVALARDRRCTIERGDALDLLPGILDDIPHDLLPVVVDSYTAVFFSNDERARLLDLLAGRGKSRDLAWISLDPLVPLGTAGHDSVQGLDVPADLVAENRHGGAFGLLGVIRFGRGHPNGRILARAHPSGTSMAWLDPGTAAG